MIADWQSFGDPLNDISRPAQMGPHWLQIRQLSGMPINERIWHVDPPASSYPACIAVKAAERQGAAAGAAYLRRLREAVMLERRNIARRDVLLALADELGAHADFNAMQFRTDLDAPTVPTAFRDNLTNVRYHDIGRFPTLVVRHNSGHAVGMVGFRPYPVLREVLARLAPTLIPVRRVSDMVAYAQEWRSVTAWEVAVACDQELATVTHALDAAVATGDLAKRGERYTYA